MSRALFRSRALQRHSFVSRPPSRSSPPLQRVSAFIRRQPKQQGLDRYVFIESRPVDADSGSDQFPATTFTWHAFGEARVPTDGHRHRSAIPQLDDQRMGADLDVLGCRCVSCPDLKYSCYAFTNSVTATLDGRPDRTHGDQRRHSPGLTIQNRIPSSGPNTHRTTIQCDSRSNVKRKNRFRMSMLAGERGHHV
jgi:hypothetical protein